MIISHTHRFAFVHIPKCAGTTIRKQLQPFDSLGGKFTKRVDKHPVLQNLDYVHIPLFTLREYFPAEFNAVQSYYSFAVMRNPINRFASSLYQRLDMYSDVPARRMSARAIRYAIDEAIEFLSNQASEPHLLPPEFIHFQRQVDYIMLDNCTVIGNIYRIDDVDKLLNDLTVRIGESIYPKREQTYVFKKSMAYKNKNLGAAIDASLPLTGFIVRRLPAKIKHVIQQKMFEPLNDQLLKYFSEAHVIDFIMEYYAQDIVLWQHYNARSRDSIDSK